MINRELVQKWLVEEGMYKNEVGDENANFHFIANYPENHMMDIIQPKNKPDMILIGCATELDPTHLNIVSTASNEKKLELIWDVRFSLNEMLLDFELEHPNDVLKRFVITDELYEDGLTKHNLIKAIKKVFKGKLQCLWKLDYNFNVNKKSNQNNMFV